MTNKKINKDRLWEMAMAFQVSKALFVANDLHIFTLLARNPLSGERVAEKLKLQPRSVCRLLNAMVAFGLLKKENGAFHNTEIADTFLVKGRGEYFGDYVSILNEVYTAWDDYETVVRENHALPLFKREPKKRNEQWGVIDGSPPDLVRRIMLAQEAFSYGQAVCLPEIYDFSRHKLLLDAGGGTGIFSIMAVKANPHLKAVVFDLPRVCAVARDRIRYYKTAKKVRVMEGNLLAADLPRGADVALISTILDAYDEQECRILLQKTFDALEPEGVVIVNEMMLNKDRTGPLFPAIFSLELMIERNTGDSRTVEEIRTWMKEAGFKKISTKPLKARGETYLNCKIVVGRKS